MIHHLSFAAKDPRTCASVIASLWGGEAFPFPPVAKGSWVAMAGDDRNTTIEVYPFGTELLPTEGDVDSTVANNPEQLAYGATHCAVASDLSQEEILALAKQHGWIAKYRNRGGVFGVIEFWVENRFLIEVLTAEMQAEYLAAVTPSNWRAMLAAGPPKAA